MAIIVVFFLLTISILLLYIGRELHRIKKTMDQGRRQLEDYLRVVFESAATEEDADYYRVGNDEKQILWTMEEKEQLFNEMFQEMFQ